MNTEPSIATQETPRYKEPQNKRDVTILLSRLGHTILGRTRTIARIDGRIAALNAKKTSLETERKAIVQQQEARAKEIADLIREFVEANWSWLVKKGTRTASFMNGTVSKRDVGQRTIIIDKKDHAEFFKEARRKGVARLVVRHLPPVPNLEALQENPDLARSFKTVTVIDDTKIEIKPKHSDGYIQTSVIGDADWEFGPKKKK